MKKVLIISPHPDDETLGMGGSISKFIEMNYEVFVLVVSGHLPPLYNKSVFEKTQLEAYAAFEILGVERIKFLKIPATMVGAVPVSELNQMISDVVSEFKPNMVFIPFPDRHIDHRIIFESSMVSVRPIGAGKDIELVAAYETLSETHWNAPHIESNFIHNLTIDISNYYENKIRALKCYESQLHDYPHPRSVEAVEALAKFRGSQSGFSFGESFHIIREVR